MNRHSLILCFLLFAVLCSHAQILHLRSGDVTTKPFSISSADSFNSKIDRFKGAGYIIMQFKKLPGNYERKLLASAGIELQEYIPDSAYTAVVNGKINAELLQQANVFSITELQPEQKMDSYLSKRIFPSWAVRSAGSIDVLVRINASVNTADAIAFLKENDFGLMPSELEKYGVVSLRVSMARLKDLASIPFISYVQVQPPAAQPLNRSSRNASRASLLNSSVANGGKGLNGEGVVVGIGDNADVQFHVDFSGRLINRTSITQSVHGVHTTGTLAGAGIVNEVYRGYASRATIVSQVFQGILSNAAIYANDYGMVLTNNSYGNIVECGYNGSYDLYAQILDQQAFDLPSLENVFAAGNSGSSTCPPYAQGFHTVLGGYQSAKNILCVGATTDSGLIASFSSRGPVQDGRIKPEICAMGQAVISTWPGNTYVSSSGTSMASPAVTGGLALLYQRYRQLNGGSDPKSALIKAVACNGATDKGNTGPDYSYGFGWMNLLRSVDMLENHHYVSSTISNSNTNTHTITVPANTAQLKVMLYWHDPPAALISNHTLVNDLDLELRTPSSQTILPLSPDTSAANLALPAISKADHINNMEQVVINAPAAGNYIINVKGTAITQNGSQEYFVVYDPIPVSLKLTYPLGGEPLVPGETIKIQWDSYGDTTSTFSLQFSIDSGSTWTNIVSGLNAARRIYSWTVPALTTNKAMVRVIKESTNVSSSSNSFVIAGQPVISFSPVQCESYAALTWTAVAGATDYEVMRLQKTEMVPFATTSTTSFTFSGLNKDSVYWFTVRARINGQAGRRAVAISRKPDNGNCSGNISDNDLKIEAIISPNSGRKFTSTELTSSGIITVMIKNLDDAAANNVSVKYSVNGSTYVSETIPSIPAGANYVYSFSSPADLSAPGTYMIKAVVTNSVTDPVSLNDTLVKTIKQIDNQPVDLTTPFIDGFETAIPAVYTKDTTGIAGIERYDYKQSTSFGRLRTFVNTGIAHSGSKAITMDIDRVSSAGNINYLVATFNLAAYNATINDIRLDFYFMHHGQVADPANMVWIRGNDQQSWIPAYDLFANQDDAGVYKKTSAIEISRLLTSNGQNFSSSFQVRWGQFGQQPAADKETGAGYTIDDIRLFIVNNDLQLISIDEPINSSCSLTSASTIKITVRNSSFNAVSNVPVRYRINSGSWVSEILPVINAGSSIAYTFNTKADLSAFGNFLIEAVVDYPGDSFHENDTAKLTVVNSPLISSFPYLENFESGKKYWYAAGKNTSWEFGTPASYHINKAASGTKSWKTRLAGNYNDMELSYLYSPCFNISALTKPYLSFSVALDLEDCGTSLCDAAWVEYSADGINWTKLGTAGSGVNWYNKVNGDLWSMQSYWRWHVATIPLPAGISNLRLRFVIQSDQGVNREGIAIDDIHIYDNVKGIYTGPSVTAPVKNVVANQWTDFESNGKKIASVFSPTRSLANTRVSVYIDTTSRWNNAQYYHPRNITIIPDERSTDDSVTVRFYFTDAETEKLLTATGCANCTKPTDAYDLGVSKYSDPDTTFENGIVTDDQQGIWTFIKQSRAIVPFDIGYYAEFKVKDFSEFWLNNGGLDKSTPLPVKLMEFFAKRSGNDAILSWKTGSESEVLRYEIEVAKGDQAMQTGNFIKIGEVSSGGNSISNRQYNFTDTEPGKSGTRYYRLKIVNINGTVFYSPVRPVVFDENMWQVYPNPSAGLFYLLYRINDQEVIYASVYDAKGRLVKKVRQTGNGLTQKMQIDLQPFATGIYLLRLETLNSKQSFKLYKK
jgi:hypothetical protein